ncbi:hypothetical protein Acsp01_54340 [Actinoplanes sp. NBRC 101535]|nr:hypothetical protein Acsp01_54340 [Actinoplanes sp. NBRC 101535]
MSGLMRVGRESRIVTVPGRFVRFMSSTAIIDLPVYRWDTAVSHRRSLLRTQVAHHF